MTRKNFALSMNRLKIRVITDGKSRREISLKIKLAIIRILGK